MLSLLGWINGITVSIKVIFDVIAGSIFLYKFKKDKVRLLVYFAFSYLSVSVIFLPYFIDFVNILLTDLNLNLESYNILSLARTMIAEPVLISFIYVGITLLLKEKRRYMLWIYLILLTIYEVSFIFNYASVTAFDIPSIPGENLIFIQIVFNTPQFIILAITFGTILIFNGFGFFYKSIQSEGVIKKKFMMLSLAFLMFFGAGIFETLFEPGFYLLFTRTIFESTAFFVYFAIMSKRVKKFKKKSYELEKELISFMKRESKEDMIAQPPNYDIRSEKDNLVIFISYSTKDAEKYKINLVSEKLLEYKEIKEVLYWQEHMKDNIIKYMNDNLGRCNAMLLFCSKNALNSVPVEKEWTAAEALNKPIIPIFEDSRHIPPLLSSRLGLEYEIRNIEKFIKELYDLIVKKSVAII